MPIVYAAAAPEAESGRYYGPDGLLEFRGYPTIARVAPWSGDLALASRLWAASERLSGVTFRFEAGRTSGEAVPEEMAAGPGPLRYDGPG